ncbi:MAG TPA: 2TM domain-containing protein [Thermomicrobiales bacterium]|nr:2TM domain-containing protein [Thermomicrobiales bacterium]
MPNDSLLTPELARKKAQERADELKGFATHLGVYLIVVFGLFFIDLASGAGWWFFYPAIAWGVGLAIHGMTVGVGRVFDEGWTDRKSREWLAQAEAPVQPAHAPVTPRRAAGRDVIAQSGVLIDQMRQASRAIPKPDVRQRALGLCASADLVLSAIEENPGEAALANDFLDRYLTPASTIITGYSRLANRNIASARPTLEKVENHDLNVLATKLDDIHDRLHRGSLIDLEVAREMLSLDITDWDDTSLDEIEASSRGDRPT